MKPSLSTTATRSLASANGRPRYAVVGTGAAGLGVLTALLDASTQAEITVFDIDEAIHLGPVKRPGFEEEIERFYDDLYREIRATQPRKFPPPKTHFATPLPKHPVGKKRSLFRSETLGGLTNFWGGTMLPFTDRELAGWPLDRAALEPGYRRMAEVAGIAGRRDALNEYFGEDFTNRPPLEPLPMMQRLDDAVNRSASDGAFRIVSGVNRCSLETREDHPKRCVYCGECMAGCFKGAVYTARQTIEQYLKDPRVLGPIRGRVMAVDAERKAVRYHDGSREQTIEGFDKVFLCAGCPGTTEIVLRSTGIRQSAPMADNAVYVFPIFYLGRLKKENRPRPYVSQSNLIFGCVPQTPDGVFAQAQIYPNFDYLWRYNMPPRFWGLFRPMMPYWRGRVFWARLYVDGSLSQAYSMTLEDDRPVFDLACLAGGGRSVKKLMKSIRRAVCREGFWVPPVRPLLQKTNSHYAATLPYGGPTIHVAPDGEVMPAVYLCDSTCFPDLPAVSLTFTIMANAYRTACQAIARTELRTPHELSCAR